MVLKVITLAFQNFKVAVVERRASSLYIEKVAEGLIYGGV